MWIGNGVHTTVKEREKLGFLPSERLHEKETNKMKPNGQCELDWLHKAINEATDALPFNHSSAKYIV